MSPLLARGNARSRRRRLTAAAKAAVTAQEKGLGADPMQPALGPARLAELERTLARLARDLDRGAGGDARDRAAARGVRHLAEAYGDLAAAERETDPVAGAKLSARAWRQLDAAVADRRKAGDAWPL